MEELTKEQEDLILEEGMKEIRNRNKNVVLNYENWKWINLLKCLKNFRTLNDVVSSIKKFLEKIDEDYINKL